MSWDALTGYELRNLPVHLSAARRWADLVEVVSDTGYLRVALRRLGLADLTQILNELTADPAIAAELRTTVVELRGIVVDEASFLAAPQYADYDGPFWNHLASVWVREHPSGARPPVWCDLDDVGQEGWLHLAAHYGRSIRRAKRFFMPGQRKSYGWDSYNAGPAGVHTRLAVDLRRMRLLGEALSLYYSEWDGFEPVHYDWRIWDLRSGALLYERSGNANRGRIKDIEEDMSADGRPAAFSDPDLMGGTEGGPPYGYQAPKLIASRMLQMKTILECANSTERLFVGSDRKGPMRSIVTDADCRRIVVDDLMPSSIDPRVLVLLDGRFAMLGIGADQHIYRIDLGSEETEDSGPLPVLPPAPAALRSNGHEDSSGRCSYLLELDSRGADKPVPPLEIALERPPGDLDSYVQNAFQNGFLESSGRFIIKQNTFDMGVWHHPGGSWAGQLAVMGNRYGGGGVLEGECAVSPDGSHLICSAHGTVRVWKLDELARDQGYRLPDWELGDITLPASVTKLAFLWGGWLVAATTEQHELVVLRFLPNSAILARVGLDDRVKRLIGEPYGAMITCVSESGRITAYRFGYLAKPDVSALDGCRLTIRLQRPEARSVEVAGTFTEWYRHPLAPTGNGIWEGEFDLTADDHEYKLLANGIDWVLDPHLPFRPGPLADNNYVTVLPEPRPRLASATSATRA